MEIKNFLFEDPIHAGLSWRKMRGNAQHVGNYLEHSPQIAKIPLKHMLL